MALNLDPPHDFFHALGLFIHKFAQVESSLLFALREQAGVDPNTARAIFSGTRMDAAKSFINRLREIKGEPQNEVLSRAFAQLTEITTVRNDIVHYGTQFRGEWEPHVSNRTQAMPGRERDRPITANSLFMMIVDLDTIQSAIQSCLMTFEALPETHASIADRALHPWQYTPI